MDLNLIQYINNILDELSIFKIISIYKLENFPEKFIEVNIIKKWYIMFKEKIIIDFKDFKVPFTYVEMYCLQSDLNNEDLIKNTIWSYRILEILKTEISKLEKLIELYKDTLNNSPAEIENASKTFKNLDIEIILYDGLKKYFIIMKLYKIFFNKINDEYNNYIESDDFKLFRMYIISKLDEHPIISSNACIICFHTGVVLVEPLYNCRIYNPQTGKFRCGGQTNICLSCARTIFGLNKSYNEPHEVRCHLCRSRSDRPSKAQNAYEISAALIKTLDIVYINEDIKFKNLFGTPLNPVICNKCDKYLGSVAELYHHIRGDSGFIPCMKSRVICSCCKARVLREELSPENPLYCSECYNKTR